MPRDTDENDNGTMAQVYNVLDAYAAKLQCAFVLIHHSTKGATIPDYAVEHKGAQAFTEWVNLKSDALTAENGVGRARAYLMAAKNGEATNLPAGDKYSLHFIRDPGAATRNAMLEVLLANDSPVYRVKFGNTWYDRTNWSPPGP
jgi:hypothetical protein